MQRLSVENPGEPKIALLKGLWRAVRRVITMQKLQLNGSENFPGEL